MKSVSADNFGLLIAYLLPGFVALHGARPFVPGVAAWLAASPAAAPTVGGFLYVTLGSTAAGLIVSAVRWAAVDRLHHRTGLPEPAWAFRRYGPNQAAFDALVQDHYRYYQFYANMAVALAFAYVSGRLLGGAWPTGGTVGDAGFVLVETVLLFGSRDTLRKYYLRTTAVLDCGPVVAAGVRPLARKDRGRPRPAVRGRNPRDEPPRRVAPVGVEV